MATISGNVAATLLENCSGNIEVWLILILNMYLYIFFIHLWINDLQIYIYKYIPHIYIILLIYINYCHFQAKVNHFQLFSLINFYKIINFANTKLSILSSKTFFFSIIFILASFIYNLAKLLASVQLLYDVQPISVTVFEMNSFSLLSAESGRIRGYERKGSFCLVF